MLFVGRQYKCDLQLERVLSLFPAMKVDDAKMREELTKKMNLLIQSESASIIEITTFILFSFRHLYHFCLQNFLVFDI